MIESSILILLFTVTDVGRGCLSDVGSRKFVHVTFFNYSVEKVEYWSMSRRAIAYYVEGTTFTAAGGEFLHETMPVEIRTAAASREIPQRTTEQHLKTLRASRR